MRRALRFGAALAAAGGLLAGVAATAPAAHTKAKRVSVYDNYYSTAKVKIHPGTKLTWVWPSDVGDSHDVTTASVPKGAKKFQSPAYATGAKWSQTFKKPGTYKLYCSFHQTEMTMTVVVKKH